MLNKQILTSLIIEPRYSYIHPIESRFYKKTSVIWHTKGKMPIKDSSRYWFSRICMRIPYYPIAQYVKRFFFFLNAWAIFYIKTDDSCLHILEARRHITFIGVRRLFYGGRNNALKWDFRRPKCIAHRQTISKLEQIPSMNGVHWSDREPSNKPCVINVKLPKITIIY